MKILALDDEYLALRGLENALRESCPDDEVTVFRDVEQAFAYAKQNPPDVAFLDIELRTDSGVSVAKRLKELNASINIIFVTGYADYMKDAFDMHASGYVLKPVTAARVGEELRNLRFVPTKKRVQVRTFGLFSALVDGKPLSFRWGKTLELFALLIDANGSLCLIDDVLEKLWNGEDTKQNRSYLRNLVSDLRRTLESHGADDILVNPRGSLGIVRDKIDCDYFDFLDKKPAALDAFHEAYMSQYSWAEVTLGAMMCGRL